MKWIDAALERMPSVGRDVWVHADANEDRRHRSSAYVTALGGRVLG